MSRRVISCGSSGSMRSTSPFHLEPGGDALDQVDGTRHGAEMHAFRGGALLDVADVAMQRLGEERHRAQAVGTREDPGIHHTAQRGAVRRARRVVSDVLRDGLVRERVVKAREEAPELLRREEVENLKTSGCARPCGRRSRSFGRAPWDAACSSRLGAPPLPRRSMAARRRSTRSRPTMTSCSWCRTETSSPSTRPPGSTRRHRGPARSRSPRRRPRQSWRACVRSSPQRLRLGSRPWRRQGQSSNSSCRWRSRWRSSRSPSSVSSSRFDVVPAF